VEDEVHRSGDADDETGQASGERDLVIRFDEQMDVVCLNGVVNEAKPRSGRFGERAVYRKKDGLFAQTG
jgi:hypothetical protein